LLSAYLHFFCQPGTSLTEAANSVFINAKQSVSPVNEVRAGESLKKKRKSGQQIKVQWSPLQHPLFITSRTSCCTVGLILTV